VLFVHEKSDQDNDSILEYLSDVVIHLYRETKSGKIQRTIETLESRFQHVHSGRHPFFIKQHHHETFSVYPLTTSISGIIPLQQSMISANPKAKEFGIKIDGILNYFEYCHNKRYDMQPYLLKNSITLLDGDRGCHKSLFGYSFAESAFRDELWVNNKGDVCEIDYKKTRPNKILNEIAFDHINNIHPASKCIGMVLQYGETYNEDTKRDIVWDTFFGKVILPQCRNEKNEHLLFGQVSIIVCFFEVMYFSEDVYLSIIRAIIRALKTYGVGDQIPAKYDDFIHNAVMTDISDSGLIKPRPQSCVFNPSYIIYNETSYLETHIEKVKDEIEKKCKEYKKVVNIQDLWIDHSTEIVDPESKWCYYKPEVPIIVSRLIVDNCENMVNVFPQINAKNLLSILAHFCQSNKITAIVINTIDYGQRNDVNDVCQAVADNVIMFRKINLFGNWYPTMRITRSANSFHTEMMYHVYKRKDGLLELLDSFSLMKSFDCLDYSILPIRIFSPGVSKETMDYSSNIKLKLLEVKRMTEFKLMGVDNKLPKQYVANYNFNNLMGSDEAKTHTINEWHNYLKDMISASLSHMDVNIITKFYSISDISIILDNESVKDAITLMVLPGHLLGRYQKNLQSVSDYISFFDKPKYNYTVENGHNNSCFVDEKKTLISCERKDDKDEEALFGKTNHYLHTSSAKIYSPNKKDDEYIIPEILFNPVVERYQFEQNNDSSKSNKIRIKDRGDDGENQEGKGPIGRVDIKAYPYFLDPRLDLVLKSKKDNSGKIQKLYNNRTAEDYLSSLVENLLSKHKDVSNHEYIFDAAKLICDLTNKKQKFEALYIRDWFSSHQDLFNTLMKYYPQIFDHYAISYEIPYSYLYQTWYLGIPISSPRRDLACEIMVKMTEPHDLEFLRITGLGIQVVQGAYPEDNSADKYIPELKYHDLQLSLEQKCPDKKGYPISYLPCFYELVTPIGGILRNYVMDHNSKKKGKGIKLDDNIKKRIMDSIKIEACSSCLFRNKYKKCPFEMLGKLWLNKEVVNLKAEFESGKSVAQIAKIHQRTVWAIKFQLLKMDIIPS
jgi:hypothetical protein